ncbi:MAG TPA: Tol-Pal system beta propeller repeat protein TolB, partial [Steroidobacteraceae bacterium]
MNSVMTHWIAGPSREFARRVCGCALLALASFALGVMPVRADLQILITKGVTDPIPIAIVPFARAVPADGGFDVAAVVQHDLESSGRFRAMQRRDMLTTPTSASDVQAADWKAAGNDYVVVGRVTAASGGEIDLECDLINIQTGTRVASQKFIANANNLRNASHLVSDFIYGKVLGVRGAFATRIAYVAVQGKPPSQRFQLIVADADGENPKVILESLQPIMSPAWSPDEQWLAYVSFENRLSGVYVQKVHTGERQLVSARVGVNGAPAYSPDGTRLALTLSGAGGNLDVWLLDLATQGLTRLTDDPAVDTEPNWSADGKSVYFTSDRAGGPQIYKVDIAQPKRIERITFGSSYNARPRISPDGKKLAFVTREGGNYRIAVQDLASGTVSVLSHGVLDESPSFAPNGAVVIYA